MTQANSLMEIRMLIKTIVNCSALLTLLLLPACGGGATTRQSSEEIKLTDRVTTLMGGSPHAKAVTQTGKATAFRIKQDPKQDYEEVIISEGAALTPEQRAALVELLARDDAYEWEIAKGCEPMPGVLITFEDGATYARLRICFECKMLGFTPGSWEDFDPVYNDLVKWAKDVFPDDAVIQGL